MIARRVDGKIVLLPDNSKSIAVVFTFGDGEEAFAAEHGVQGLVKRHRGVELFGLLRRLPLDGIVFNPSGPGASKRVDHSYAHEVLVSVDPWDLQQVLPCRSVAEAHLAMDLQGAGADRKHLLVADGDDLVAYYETDKGTFKFRSPPNPLIEGYGGTEASLIVCPGQWLRLAEVLAQQVPAAPRDDEEERQRGLRRISLAIAFIDETLKFLGAHEGPLTFADFFSREGREMVLEQPGRFRRSRLLAVRGAYQEVADRYTAD